MTVIHELLREIGLSDKEATMYVTLLRSGTQTTSYLAKKAHFNRGTAYVILHTLLRKGLAVETVRSKIQYFTALDPKSLLSYLDHRASEATSQRKKVEQAMSQLLSIKNPHTAQPKIQFFEGVEGARAALEDTLTSKEETLRAFISIGDVALFVGLDYYDEYTSRRIKGHRLNVIRTLGKDKEAMTFDPHAQRYMTSKKEKRQVRYLDDSVPFPVTIYMYDNKMCVISSKEENFALIIESKELTEMQKKLFELLWKSIGKNASGKKGD